MTVKRDVLGYISLDNIQNINMLPNSDSFSFDLDGNKYFFKKAKSIRQAYNELIGYELAKDFGIDAVSYDLASYHNDIGFISKDYMKDGYYYLEELLESYYGSYNGKNNLYDVSIMFMYLLPEEKMNILLDDFRRLLMFDIIIGNSDRHDRNIIVDSNTMRLGPVFDNEMLGNEDCYFSFSMNGHDDNTISEFLSVLSIDELEFFSSKLNIISEDNLLDIFNRIESKIGTKMNDSIKEELLRKYNNYSSYLLKVLNVMRGNRLKLEK